MNKKSFLFNLIVVLLLCIGLYILFFASLRWITHHGEEVKIPNVTGKDMREAISILDGMNFDVYVDSTYDPKQKQFAVLSQTPDIGSVVKMGRTVFLTVNKALPPQTPMPNLISLSYRSAEMILRNNKLLIGDTTYKPDIAAGAVLQQLYMGKDIKAGQMVPEGSKISLVIGDGLGITQFNVPDVTGMSYDEAITYLTGSGLQYTAVWEGSITDSSTAVVYAQSPSATNEANQPNRIKAGDIVDLRIKQTADADNTNPAPDVNSQNPNPNP
jgi:eukaryotic-like serine/threonine-protein kinase